MKERTVMDQQKRQNKQVEKQQDFDPRNMEQQDKKPGDTVEGKAKTRNGVKRMIFALGSIALEMAVLLIQILRLNEYSIWIEAGLHIFALILVLVIYSKAVTSSMKMPWIILILLMPIFGTSLYVLVGINGGTGKMRREYKKIDEKLFPLLTEKDKGLEKTLAGKDPAAAGIASYLKKYAGYPLWQNTDVTYYDDASAGLEAQLADLRLAKQFIFMEYHAIEDSTSWRRIEQILAEKAAQGVEVRVFYDDMGSIGFITTDFIKKLEKKGIACRVFNPFGPGLNLFLNNRDHRKITVIDGKVGFTGGYNLADEYFNLTHPYGLWKDTGVRLEGDAVRALTVTFLEMWNAGRHKRRQKEDKDYRRYLPEYSYQARQNGYIMPYADSPMDKERIGEEVYISMLNKADHYCYFVSPYLILTDEMIHALSLAAKRGVDVRIITPGIPDKKLVYSVTRSFYHALVANGVRIYEWTPGFCHCKMSVADDKMATCGTINLDYRSLYHHFENGCWMYDPEIAVQIRSDFEQMFTQSREVTDDYREGRNAFLRTSQLIMRLFAELL